LAQFVENASSTVPWNQEIPLAPPRPRLAELFASPDAGPGDFVVGACEVVAAGDFGPGTGSTCLYLQPLMAIATVTAAAANNIDLDLMASPFTWAFARSSPLRSGDQCARGAAHRRARNGRWPTVQYYKVGVSGDGTLQALQLRGYSGMGPYRKNSGNIGGVELYQVPHLEAVVHPVYTNKTTGANFRGPEFPQGFFGIQSMMDDVAYKAIDIRPDELSELRKPFFLLFNVAVGGDWPGSPDATSAFPQEMLVDYVRVYRRAN